MSKFSLSDWLLGKSQDADPTPEDLDTLKTELSAVRSQYAALQTEKDALENRVKKFESDVTALQATVAQYKTDVEALQADVEAKTKEIEALKSEAADEHTGGDTQPPAGGAKRAYMNNPINAHLKAKN